MVKVVLEVLPTYRSELMLLNSFGGLTVLSREEDQAGQDLIYSFPQETPLDCPSNATSLPQSGLCVLQEGIKAARLTSPS